MAGEGFAIEDIEIRGNEKTKPEIIIRALPLEIGDTLSAQLVEQSKIALDRTRLFTTIHVASRPGTKPEHAVLVVFVVEKRFGDLGVSVEYTELDGFGVAADAYHVNLAGEGKIAGVSWGAGERFKQWRFTYADPWLTRANLLFSLEVSGSSADRDLFRAKDPLERGRYDLERIGGRISLGKAIGDARILARYAYEEVQVGAYTRPTVVTDQGEFADEIGNSVGRESLAYIGLELHGSTSTEPHGTIPGHEYRATVDLSSKYLGSSDTFLKIGAEAFRHLAVKDSQILSLGVRTGIILGSEPFYERFYLDDRRQLRGFERREIGPEGGEEFVLAEVLYSIPFHRVGRAYAFIEGATVRRDFVTGSRADQGGTLGIGVILFNRVDISLGMGTGTLIIKSHRFGGINVGL